MESRECSAGKDNEYAEQLKSPKKRKERNFKQRFTDEQIRSLESIFESQTKLEPRKKAQLASELGLQPRQVAIWFQNRRARWRSKSIEQEYNVLKAKYDDLSSQFESLKEETQSLLIQLQALNDKLEEAHETNMDSKNIKSHSIEGNSVTTMQDRDWKATPCVAFDALEYLNISDSENRSLASIDGWSSEFYSGNLFDQTISTTNWSDFWT